MGGKAMMNSSSVVKLSELIEKERENRETQERYEIAQKYAILDRVQAKAREWRIVIPREALDDITRMSADADYSVLVLARKPENPCVAKVGEDKLFYYQIAPNESNTGKQYVLSIWYSLSPEAEKVLRAKKFGKWLSGKGIPFATEVLERVNLCEDIDVHIHRSMHNFVLDAMKRWSEITDSDFIGQTVNNCSFSKAKPVGIVKGNVVNIYDPTWRYKESAWTFRVPAER
jgi:hypothetical protein